MNIRQRDVYCKAQCKLVLIKRTSVYFCAHMTQKPHVAEKPGAVLRNTDSLANFHASATVEKRWRKHTVFGSVVSVSEWVNASVRPENIVNTISKKQWREFHPILVTNVYRFVYVLIRFWGSKVQRSRSQQPMTRKPCDHTSHKPVKGISPSFDHRCICVRRCAD